ncbi:MAG: rhomboid family intramembrane serine protease [Verrucomicrobiota bacterium]
MELPAWTDRLERWLGDWSIPYLIRGLIGLNVLVWLLDGFSQSGDGSQSFASFLYLHPDLVSQGEYWRMITFLFIPSVGQSMLSPLFMLFFVFFTWFISDILEGTWGSFKITVYFLIGIVAINLTAFLAPSIGTNIFLMQSLLFCAAVLYPNVEITLFPIPIPIKLKWIGLFYAGMLTLSFLGSPPYRSMILASLLPFALFIGPGTVQLIRARRDAQARMKRFRGED